MRFLFIILISFLFTKSYSVNSQALEAVDVTSEGNRYIGEVLNGQRHGKGTLILANGDKYEGEWKNGQRHGKGIFIEANGKYEGEWKNDKMHGNGVFTSPDISYEGEWKNGQMNGQGILVEKDGKYDGEFLNGKMHGQGILNLNDGRVVKGEFKNGKYIGVSRTTNNKLAKGQNIKKVEDEVITGNPEEIHKQLLKKIETQQKIEESERNILEEQQADEEERRIEKQVEAQRKKEAEIRKKAVEEREREYQEEERKKLEEEQRAENERKRLEEKRKAEDVCLNRKRGTFTSAVCFIVEDTFKTSLFGGTFSPNKIMKVDEKECTMEVKGINSYKMDWNKVKVNTIEFGDNGTNGWIKGEGAEGVMSNGCGFILPCAPGTFQIMMNSILHRNSVDRSRINKALSSIYSNYCVGQESEF